MGSRLRGDYSWCLLLQAFALFALLLGFTAPASAHPHVWVTAASELIYAADGSISGVRHAWTFDDMFSTYAVQGIESRTKGVYTREELAPLAQTNVESLKEFGFFTFAKADGKKEKFLEPVDYFLEQKDGVLVLHFTLPFRTPVRTRQLALEVFDPTFFVDFSLQKKDPIRLAGARCADRRRGRLAVGQAIRILPRDIGDHPRGEIRRQRGVEPACDLVRLRDFSRRRPGPRQGGDFLLPGCERRNRAARDRAV